ncbi:MAG TPA: hypothetical protein DHW02_12885 [Ktedonobacter sp.]|nr:hypothetical protein [Ktedonobacter sp.]
MGIRRRIEPKPGQESVWDYPRPPRLEDSNKHIQIVFNGVIIADTHRAKRILETSHPPVYYIPPEDIKMEYLLTSSRTTFCEFKGQASYYTIMINGKSVPHGAWYYLYPSHGYESIANYVAFYPSKMDACFVNGEKVQAQQSDFYGSWITSRVVGPFKGGPGTSGW